MKKKLCLLFLTLVVLSVIQSNKPILVFASQQSEPVPVSTVLSNNTVLPGETSWLSVIWESSVSTADQLLVKIITPGDLLQNADTFCTKRYCQSEFNLENSKTSGLTLVVGLEAQKPGKYRVQVDWQEVGGQERSGTDYLTLYVRAGGRLRFHP